MMLPGPTPDSAAGIPADRPPAVSVITPTWGRHEMLMSRCIPSVLAQEFKGTEHIIVSDGPDPQLAYRLGPNGPDGRRNLLYYELASHSPDKHYGHLARLAGIEYASADLITYCDDDDALRKSHVSEMARALNNSPEAGFAVSRMMSHGPSGPAVVGWGALGCGNVGTPMLMRHRWVLEHGTWGPASQYEDWELVERWLHAGIRYVNVDAETSDVWPSVFR
jgi:glycosyltransferase involved in cell wall biosynthesis